MAGEPAFLDTNILVYASQKQSPYHLRAVTWLQQARRDSLELWISRQMLREYLSAITRPQPDQASLPVAQAVADVESFERDFNVAEDGPEVFNQLLGLVARFPTGGKQVHDANLVATMIVHGITRLLTFNTGDFRRFGLMIEIIVP